MIRFAALALIFLAGCGPFDSGVAQFEDLVGLGKTERVHEALRYGPGAHQVFDAYMPTGHGSLRPLIVAVHPGAWQGDSRSWVDHFADQYTSRGFAVFSIDFTEAQESPFPADLDDVRTALRFFRAAGPRLGIDPDRVAILGDSAGGHLALLAGLVADPLAERLSWARPRAIVTSAAVTDLTLEQDWLMRVLFGHEPTRDELFGASPIAYARRDASVLLIHGELDTDVNVVHGDELNARLLGVGADLLYLRRHTSQHIAFKDERVNDVVTEWLSSRI